MWSDKLTAKAEEMEKLFDLVCEHPELGETSVLYNLTFEEAVQLAESGGVEKARFALECAWADQICVELQRPGKYAEMLVPHDPF